MTCDSALAAMLDAELAELSPHHQGPLGRHLRDCGRCRRVANQLREDSAQLSAMVEAPRAARASTSVRAVPWMAGAIATAAVLLVVRGVRDQAPGRQGAPVQPGGTTTQAPAPPAVQAAVPPTSGRVQLPHAPVATSPTRRGRGPIVVAAAGIAPVTFDPPEPTEAVAFDPPEATIAVAFEAPTAVSPVPLYATPTVAVVARIAPREGPLTSPNRGVTAVPSRLPGVTALWFN